MIIVIYLQKLSLTNPQITMKKALFPLLFLCFLLTNLAKAQDTTATKCNKKADDCSSECSSDKPKFFHNIALGVQFLELGNLNTKLKDAGFNEAYTMPMTFVISGGVTNGKHVLGGSFAMTNSKNKSNNQLTAVNLTRFDAYYGYALKLSNRFTFLPTIGIGGTENRMTLQKSASNVTLTSALAGSLTSTTLTSQSMGAVLGTKFIFKMNKNKRNVVSLNLNYYLPVYDYNWRANGQDISDVPKANFGGFTATLGFGIF